MKSTLLITDLYYKPNSVNINSDIPEINEIVSAKGDVPSIAIIINSGNKSIRYVGDNSPGLSIKSLPQYRISVESQFDYTLHPVGYIRDNNEIKVADIIYNSRSMDYSGDELPYIICDFKFPENIKAGIYIAKINLYLSDGLKDETLVESKNITINIKPYSLPMPCDYTLYNDIWQHNSNIARTFGIELWSEKHFAIIDKVLKKLKKLGQKSATIVVSDCPWRGWGCYLMRENPANMFEYSCINSYKNTDGSFSYDYSALDKLISMYSENGIQGDITLYGIIGIWRMPLFNTDTVDYPEQIKIRYIDKKDGSIKYMQKKEDIIRYLTCLFEHLKNINVWDRIRIGADEPSIIEPFLANLEILKTICKDIKLKLAIDKPEIIQALGNECEDLAFSFPCALENYNKEISSKRKFYYVCNIPDRPNSQLHNSISDNVAVILLNHKFCFSGFLRWAFTCWTSAPLRDIRYNVNSLPAGDLYLVYPSQDGEILESLRYRAFEKGIVLYELLERVKRKNITIFNQLLNTVINNQDKSYEINSKIGISQDIKDFRNLYSELLDALIAQEN